MTELNCKQQIQEDQYYFPYHYLDQYSELHRRIIFLDYLSMLKIVKRTLKFHSVHKLLDAGCGDGRLCFELRDDNITIVGVDYSARAIGFAKAFNPNVDFHIISLTKLTFSNEFDFITLLEVLEHIPPPNIRPIISSLWKALKVGGLLLVCIPTTNLPLSAKHYQHFTADSLQSIFSDYFETVQIIGHLNAGKAWYRFLWLQKYAQLAWPLHKRFLVNKFIEYVEKYYQKNLESCAIENAGRLIVTFRKKPQASRFKSCAE